MGRFVLMNKVNMSLLCDLEKFLLSRRRDRKLYEVFDSTFSVHSVKRVDYRKAVYLATFHDGSTCFVRVANRAMKQVEPYIKFVNSWADAERTEENETLLRIIENEETFTGITMKAVETLYAGKNVNFEVAEFIDGMYIVRVDGLVVNYLMFSEFFPSEALKPIVHTSFEWKAVDAVQN